MSALTPKADMCRANRDVGFGPKADMCAAKRETRFTPNSEGESEPEARPYDLSTRLSLTSGASLREPLSIQTASANAPYWMASTKRSSSVSTAMSPQRSFGFQK